MNTLPSSPERCVLGGLRLDEHRPMRGETGNEKRRTGCADRSLRVPLCMRGRTPASIPLTGALPPDKTNRPSPTLATRAAYEECLGAAKRSAAQSTGGNPSLGLPPHSSMPWAHTIETVQIAGFRYQRDITSVHMFTKRAAL